MKIIGKNIVLREILLEDTEFVFNLRIDENKNKFISKNDLSIEKQLLYIKSYINRRHEEYYFIIQNLIGEKLGTVRVYDIKNGSFCWGSWILKDSAPFFTSIESALLVYNFAFYKLMLLESNFDVRKENKRVLEFHKRMGAKIVSDDEENYYFNYKKKDFDLIKPKYKKYLND